MISLHPWHTARYAAYLAIELVKGAGAIAADVATPGSKLAPAIIEFPLRCSTDLEITWLASSITVTPGTLVVGTASATEDHPATLFVHVMYAKSREQVLADLRDMESRLLRATRGRRADEVPMAPGPNPIGHDRRGRT